MSRSTQACALFSAALLVSSVAAAQPGWAPPPEPEVAPQIPVTESLDADGDKLDDALDDELVELDARAQAAPGDAAQLNEELAALIPIELVFSRQVTQQQIDAFLALGGQIDHMFRAVSYGWTGRLPRAAVASLPAVMGKSLVVVVEDQPGEPTMEEATLTGRVRPVWASGFAGNPSGFSGNSNITIAIIDTGLDDSHSDLTGRMEYWMDYTADAEATPIDVVGHGSHVAGIALGTGASFGLGPGGMVYTDSGNLTGASPGFGGIFMVHLPAGSLTFTHDATWLGGGMTNLASVLRANGGGSLFAQSAAATGSSGSLVESNTFVASTANGYSSLLVQNATGTVGAFAIVNTISSYPAVGDGFNVFRGVAPVSRWAGAKVFTNTGLGGSATFGAAFDDMVVQRIAHNIKVANFSGGIVGSPGLNPTLRAKANTMVNNGIVTVLAVGNDGPGTAAANLIDDPARASLALSVAASNDINELTTYSSSGFLSPGADEDNKPDLIAPGGSNFQSAILSVDSNDADGDTAGFADRFPQDYRAQSGTSMSSPFVAGAASLVIDALQQAGLTWDFSSSTHPLLVKMLLCASATETNANREAGSGSDPTLGRAVTPKDRFEGYGLINPDAAIEAVSVAFTGAGIADSTAGGRFDRRAWGRRVALTSGASLTVNLAVPAAADYDLYLYGSTPDTKGNPVILASSANAGLDTDESIFYVPSTTETGYLFVKRVTGSGGWSMSGVFATTSTTTSTSSTTSTTGTTLPTTDLLPGRIVVIKPATLAKFVGKPVTGDTFTLPTVNPIASGGSLRIFDVAATAGDNTYSLPAGVAWKGLGNPAGSKGYKYKGAGSVGDPCKVVVVKEKVIKAVCKGAGVTLAPPFAGEVGIELSLGATDRYCASYGGDEVRNDGTLTKRKNAPAPGGCP